MIGATAAVLNRWTSPEVTQSSPNGGRCLSVTLYGNILDRWASIGEAGTSSSRGKAITRRGMCTFIATAS